MSKTSLRHSLALFLCLFAASAAQASPQIYNHNRLYSAVDGFYKLFEHNVSHCFVAEGNTLAFHLRRCEGLSGQKPHQVFELSDAPRTRLATDIEKLETQLLNSGVASAEKIAQLKELAKKDTAGQLIFMSLKGKKFPVGWLSHDLELDGQAHNHQILDLCSGAWAFGCHFDREDSSFKISFLDKRKDEETGDMLAVERGEILDVLYAGVYSRGNDDFVSYHYYNVKGTGAQSGKTFAISEEWKNALEPHLTPGRLDPEVKQSITPRGEPNYLTALHPVYIFRVKSFDGLEQTQLVFGGAVVYLKNSPAANSCEDDTGSYRIVDFDQFKDRLPVPYNGRDIEKLNISNLGNSGSLIGSDFGAYNFGEFDSSTLPPALESPHYDLFNIGTALAIDAKRANQTFVILKVDTSTIEGYNGRKDIYVEEKRSNAFREYVEVARNAQGIWSVNVSAFNPNDYKNANVVRPDGKLFINSETISEIWSSHKTDLGVSQPFQRAPAMELKALEKNSVRGKEPGAWYAALSNLHNKYPLENFQIWTTHAKTGLRGSYINAFDYYLTYGGKESVIDNPMGRSILPRIVPKNIWMSLADLEKETLKPIHPMVIEIYTKDRAQKLQATTSEVLARIAQADNPREQIQKEYELAENISEQSSFVSSFFSNFADLKTATGEMNEQIARAQKLPPSKRPQTYRSESWDDKGNQVVEEKPLPTKVKALINKGSGKFEIDAIFEEIKKSLLAMRDLEKIPGSEAKIQTEGRKMYKTIIEHRELLDLRFVLRVTIDKIEKSGAGR